MTTPRMVNCAKLKTELPAIKYKPFSNDLGQRIFDQISEQAWREWIEYSKRIVNEYRLDLASSMGQRVLMEQAEQFFFGDGGKAPPEYVPAKT